MIKLAIEQGSQIPAWLCFGIWGLIFIMGGLYIRYDNKKIKKRYGEDRLA